MVGEEKSASDSEAQGTSRGRKDLRQALAAEKENAEKYLANWQRAEADLSNYRKRAEQEKNEFVQYANTQLIIKLLPVLDDLERAFAALPRELEGVEWVNGIELIQQKLRGLLESEYCSAIEAVGQPFDPNLHEACMHQEGEEGMVIDEVQKGYKLRDKVIRASMVTVGKGNEDQNQ